MNKPKEYNSRAALLVGVNTSGASFPSLQFCENDIRAIGEILKRDGYGKVSQNSLDTAGLLLIPRNSHGKEILSSRDTVLIDLQETITHALRHRADDSPASTESAFILFHFSGHGNWDEENREMELFCHLKRGDCKIRVSEITGELEKHPQIDYLILIDACRVQDKPRGTFTSRPKPKILQKNCRVNFYGASSNETAQEDEAHKMGVFSFYISRALQGKNCFEKTISWQHLYQSVRHEMMAASLTQQPDANGPHENFVIIKDCKPVLPDFINPASITAGELLAFVEANASQLQHLPQAERRDPKHSTETYFARIKRSLLPPMDEQYQGKALPTEPVMMRVLKHLVDAHRDLVEVSERTQFKQTFGQIGQIKT